MFTQAEMNQHIARSGKNIGNIHHHSVPTTLRKAKTFLEDEYLHEIMATCDEHCFYFKAKCCHSYKKNDPPHQLKLTLCVVKGDILNSTCTCVAGKVGFCNHTSALMLKLCKLSLLEAQNYKELTKRHRRESASSMYFPASILEQERRRRKYSSSTCHGGCGKKGKTG